MDSVVTRSTSIGLKVWLRIVSPSTMRLLAPLLGIALFLLAQRWYRRAGRTALGRAVRWWCLALAFCLVGAVLAYLLTVFPDDPDALDAIRSAETERLGRTLMPVWLAVAGAVVFLMASATTAWRWRQSRQHPDELAALDAQWQAARGRWLRRTALFAGVPLALLVTACAAAGLAPAAVPAASSTSSGSLWVATSAGVSRLVPGPTPRWEAFAPPHAPLPDQRVTGVVAASDGAVWMATRRGLLRYAPESGGSPWRDATFAGGALPYPEVLAIAVDREGVAWAATGAGGAGVTPEGAAITFSDRNAPLLHLILDAVYVDPAGRVWFGGAGGVNVYRPPLAGQVEGEWPVGFTRYSTNGGLPDDLVFVIFGDRKGRIWFGTNAGVGVLTPDPTAFGLGAYEPSHWQTFTKATSPLPSDKVHAIAEDAQGRIWLGTEQGIAVYDDSASGQVRWSALDSNGAPGLPSPWVQALVRGPDGRMWAGTHGGGLAVYDPASSAKGWTVYRANALRRWMGYLWPPHWQRNILSDDVTALAWAP